MSRKKPWFARVKSPVSMSPMAKWLAYGVLIGVVSGLGALVFEYGLQTTTSVFVNGLLDHFPPAPAENDFGTGVYPVGRRWLLFVVPLFGAFVSGLLVYTFAPEAEGHGTDAVVRSFHRQDGRV